MQTNKPDTANLIRHKLTEALKPTSIELIDNSKAHEGHGASGGHYHLTIISPLFKGKSAIDRHRMIYAALGELMGLAIHALTITAQTEEEHSKK